MAFSLLRLNDDYKSWGNKNPFPSQIYFAVDSVLLFSGMDKRGFV